jgi:diaminobutyrate-2-oxoglutarate transaminase
MHPHLDVLSPGEHNGTFRGNNLAFVTAKRALELFWSDDRLTKEIEKKANLIEKKLTDLATKYRGVRKGRGFIQGVAFADLRLATAASKAAFERGVVIETSGANDEVLKVLAPLTISTSLLEDALNRVEAAVSDAKAELDARASAPLSVHPPAMIS